MFALSSRVQILIGDTLTHGVRSLGIVHNLLCLFTVGIQLLQGPDISRNYNQSPDSRGRVRIPGNFSVSSIWVFRYEVDVYKSVTASSAKP